MMQEMRGSAGKIIMILLGLAFVAWTAFDQLQNTSGVAAGELGRVNDRAIPYEAYRQAYQELYDQAQQQIGGPLSAAQVREVEELTWNRLVSEVLIDQELERRGIGVTDAEIAQAAQWSPHPELMRNELFLTDGQFDIRKYQQFLAGPTANDELLAMLEAYYRQAIPRNKLVRQVTSGVYLSDAELWQAWRDRNETATVEYLVLDPARLVPGNVEVSEAEIREFYERNAEEFERPATARLTVASLPKAASAADTAAALQRARALRAEILGGTPFEEVAQRESVDSASAAAGGDLGTFGRGQMVPAFEQAAFGVPVGEVSEPVLTPFGFHLIQVQERTGDEVRARHILIPIGGGEEALDRLYGRADSLEALAERGGIEQAARGTGATLRQGVTASEAMPFIPGVGSAVEALEWAEDEAEEGTPGAASPLFETPEAFYIVRAEQMTPAGTVPLQTATPGIRRRLILEKKREQARAIGEQLAAQVRGGKTLQQVATERGLTVGTAGPFTRIEPNPVLGQANAAIGAAFGVPIGQVSGVAETPTSLFLIRPTARTEADRAAWEAQKEQQRAILMAQTQEDRLGRWLESLREQAEIVDRRDEVLQPQEA